MKISMLAPFVLPLSISSALACQLTPLYGSATGVQLALQAMIDGDLFDKGMLVKNIKTENGARVEVSEASVDGSVCRVYTFRNAWRGDCAEHRTVLISTENCTKL